MKIIVSGTLVLALAACGGRPPNPVVAYQPGDEKRSCQGLKMEIASNDAEIARLLPYEDATGKNVALGVAGAVLLVPRFFMDFKHGEEIEIQALRRRNQLLRSVAAESDCSLQPDSFRVQDEPAIASGPSKEKPNCSDVGGYEEYHRRTGEVCKL